MIASYDLTAAQAIAEASLDATCTIRRPDPDAAATVDTDTGVITRATATAIHTGIACTVVPGRTAGAEGATGSRTLTGRAWTVIVPAATTGVQGGDEVAITAVGDAGLADLVGVPLTVDEVDLRSRTVLRRLHCVDTRHAPVSLP